MAAAARRRREPERDRLARETHLNVLVAASRFSDDIDRLCRAEGISHPQYVVLFVLCLTDDPDAGVPIGAIADGLLNRASDLTRLVDRLEAAGLAERRRDDADRRVVRVRATTEGQAVFARVEPAIRAYHRRQFADLDDAELASLDALLTKVLWPHLEA